MPKKNCMSLREIGRRLDIPPSTIVSYKDRFEAFIPFEERGSRRRYPPAALEIFAEIRSLSGGSASTSDIERHLALHYNSILARAGGAEGVSCPNSRVAAMRLAGVLERVTKILQDQCEVSLSAKEMQVELEALRSEVQSLKKKVASKVTAPRASGTKGSALKGSEADRQIRHMQKRLVRMRQEKDAVEEMLLHVVGIGNNRGKIPPAAFLDLPLVVRTQRGEFLGVAGRGSLKFSVRKLVTHVRRGAQGGRHVAVNWVRDDDRWGLYIRFSLSDGEHREYELDMAETLTPKKNLVACLGGMKVNGEAVPADYIRDFFRKIREEFSGSSSR